MAKDERRFVIVPREVLTEDRYAPLRADRAALGAWLLLYVEADIVWPAPAALPRWLADDALELMVRLELLTVTESDRYRLEIVDVSRETRREAKARRSAHAKVAADARWSARSNAPSNAPGNAPSIAAGNARASVEHQSSMPTKTQTQTERISPSIGRGSDIARSPRTRDHGLTRIGETT